MEDFHTDPGDIENNTAMRNNKVDTHKDQHAVLFNNCFSL